MHDGNPKDLFELSQVPEFFHEAIKMAAGLTHTLILTETGQVYAVGDNSKGNLGQGHRYSSDIPLKVHGLPNIRVSEIAAGRHSAVVTEMGQLFVWGPALDPEQVILAPQELRADRKVKTISIGETVSALINEDGHMYTWGFSNK
jgi:alpha-tubulin suppressor-like RCC1 family protein